MLVTLLLILLFLILSSFFSGTETAFTSLSDAQIHAMRDQWGPRGRMVADLTSRPQVLLTTVLTGNNLMNIALSVMASDFTIRLFGSSALGVTTGVLTLLILVFGEVAPKQLAYVHNEFWAIHSVRTVLFLTAVFKPVNWFVGAVAVWLTRLTGATQTGTLTREGIVYMIKHAESVGVLEKFRSTMVQNVLRFTDVTAQAIMTHRTRVFSLSETDTVEEALPKIHEQGYSRIPIYADHPENIVGVVLLKELLGAITEGRGRAPLREIMVDPIYIPETRPIHQILAQFHTEALNIAVVLDEYGGVAGIVTTEDIIEEILGELYDEHEVKERQKITHLQNGTYSVMADIPLYSVNESLKLDIPQTRDAQTLAGYLTETAGHIPVSNEVIDTPFGEFVVESVWKKRIVSVRFNRNPDVDGTQES